MHVLFLCSTNQLRSPTAEALFASWPGITVASAGTHPDSVHAVDSAMIEAADLILVMKEHHKETIERRYHAILGARPVIVLGIPDKYHRNQPELIELLRQKVTPILEARSRESK